jgi:hypothetical protein
MSDQTNAAEVPKSKRPAKSSGRIIQVVAKQPTRWRIGRKFGTEPVEINADELDEAEIAALIADPVLVITGNVEALAG